MVNMTGKFITSYIRIRKELNHASPKLKCRLMTESQNETIGCDMVTKEIKFMVDS